MAGEDCGPGWEWSEPLGRCICVDTEVAGPSLELPAQLDDALRRAMNAVAGTAIDSSTWAASRARTLAEWAYNQAMHLAQDGFTIATIPGVGEVTLIPGIHGEGVPLPWAPFGIPFRVRISPTAPGVEPPNGDLNRTAVIEDQADAIVAGLYWFAHPTEPEDPTPILHTLMDIQGVKAFGMTEMLPGVAWPVFRLHGLTFDQVRPIRVKAALKEEMPEGWELEGSTLLKGSIDAAAIAYVLEHLQVEIYDVEGPGGKRLVPLASVVLPFVAAVSSHTLFTDPP